MGWLVWILETALCAAASYLVACRLYPDRGVLHRLIATLLVAPSLILVAIQALGLFEVLRPWTLGLLAPVVFALPAVVAWRGMPSGQLKALWRSDVRAPLRLLRAMREERELAGLLVLGGVGVLLGAAVLVWILRSWSWDPTWYHVPITSHTISSGSIRWIDSSLQAVPWMITHPRNVEWLAVWNCIFPLDARLDDSSQLLFGVLGAAVVIAWAREVGARASFAAGLGGAWLMLPPVYLQLWSTHVDVACGATFAAAVFFLRGTPTSRDRWMCLLALGLYAGSKMTGLFHLGLLAPWLAVRALLELWRAHGERLRRAADVALSIGALLAVGGFKYIENTLREGNPFYAFKVKLPLLGELPGKYDPAGFYGTRPGQSPLFFGADGSFTRLLQSWYYDPPTFWPDVRTGGFGPVFAFLLVPAVVFVALEALRPSRWRLALPILALFAAAIVVQAPWWPRFIMGASIAALVALGYTQGLVRWKAARVVLSVALVALTAWTFATGVRQQQQFAHIFQWPQQLGEAWGRTGPERHTHQVVDWLWPERWAKAKEAEFAPGDVLLHDDSVYFLAEYFTHDYRNKVAFAPSQDVKAFLDRVDALAPVWVGVQQGTAAETALRQRGAQFLFLAPRSQNALYRLPR
jgi:hypothetical protein